MDATDETRPSRRRAWIAMTVLLVVIALAVVAALLVPRLTSAAPGPTASATPTEPPRDIIDPDAPRETAQPSPAPLESDEPFAELSPVAPDQTVVTDDGVDISLSSVQAVQGQATLAGETSGPAVRATVRIVNTGDEPLDLEYVVVNAYSGDERTPAGTLTQPGGAPFEGTLAPGDSAEGTYLFSLADDVRDDVSITVDYLLGAKVAVFRGDLR